MANKFLPQGSNSVKKLIESSLNALAYLPPVQKSQMIQALSAFNKECVPASVSFEDIDSNTERANIQLTTEEKISVMKGLIAVSRSESAQEQIVDIARTVINQRSNPNDDQFDPDATLPSLESKY